MNTQQGEQAGFCTVEELAFDWQLSAPNVYRIVQRGELPSYRFGSRIRIRRSDAEEFLKRRRRFDDVFNSYWQNGDWRN